MEEIEKLKAQAYDAIIQIENWQARLNELNRKINELKSKEK